MTGRPPFRPTPAMRKRVATLKAARMSEDQIAVVIGITRPTLRKHFAEELDAGWTKRHAQVVEAMHKLAVSGNVSAQKAWLQLTGLTPEPAAKPAGAKAKDEPIGKKAAADAAAQTAADGTDWSELVH